MFFFLSKQLLSGFVQFENHFQFSKEILRFLGYNCYSQVESLEILKLRLGEIKRGKGKAKEKNW